MVLRVYSRFLFVLRRSLEGLRVAVCHPKKTNRHLKSTFKMPVGQNSLRTRRAFSSSFGDENQPQSDFSKDRRTRANLRFFSIFEKLKKVDLNSISISISIPATCDENFGVETRRWTVIIFHWGMPLAMYLGTPCLCRNPEDDDMSCPIENRKIDKIISDSVLRDRQVNRTSDRVLDSRSATLLLSRFSISTFLFRNLQSKGENRNNSILEPKTRLKHRADVKPRKDLEQDLEQDLQQDKSREVSAVHSGILGAHRCTSI